MSGFDWAGAANAMTSIVTSLNTLNVPTSSQGSIIGQIGALMNPNKAAELGVCQQILNLSAINPALVPKMAEQLAMMPGLPVSTQALIAQLVSTPNPTPLMVSQIVTQVEALINAG